MEYSMHVPSSVMKWPRQKKERAHVIKKVFNTAKKDRKMSFSRYLSSIISPGKGSDTNSWHNKRVILYSNGRVSIPLDSSPRKLGDILAKFPFSRHCNQQLEPTDFQKTRISSHGNKDPLRTAFIKVDSNAGCNQQVEPTDFQKKRISSHGNTDSLRSEVDSNAGYPANVNPPQLL